MDRFALLFELVVDAGVITSECACSEYGDVDAIASQLSVLRSRFLAVALLRRLS
jgi:hypothetical protein